MLHLGDIESDPDGGTFEDDLDDTALLGCKDIVLVARESGSAIFTGTESLTDLTGFVVAILEMILVQPDQDRIQRPELAQRPAGGRRETTLASPLSLKLELNLIHTS